MDCYRHAIQTNWRSSQAEAHTQQRVCGAISWAAQACTKSFALKACKVSKLKILDAQPSMAEPIDKGMKYNVLRWQIVVACPRLMEVLSRTGNAGHGIARTQTALQGCKRVLTLAIAKQRETGKLDVWDQVARIASIGMPPNYIETASTYCSFVKQWAGGKDGKVLLDLEAYEKVLSVKRKIATQDLRAMANITLDEAPRYIPAMVKALLVAPGTFVVDGMASNLFTPNDYHGLSQSGNKTRTAAIQANAIMQAAHTFMDAYAVASDTDKLKLTSELEVRCVMHTHGKKAGSRATYESLLHIAEAMHKDVAEIMRANGRTIPKWSVLDPLEKIKGALPVENSSASIREFQPSGEIADIQLKDAGLVKGVVLVKKKEYRDADECEQAYKIEDASQQLVVLELANTDPIETISVNRGHLLHVFMIKQVEKIEVFDPKSYPDPSDHYELMADIAKGQIKQALRSLFKASSESKLKMMKKGRDFHVVSTQEFQKGECVIVPLSTQVLISKKQLTANNLIYLGNLFTVKKDNAYAYIKSMAQMTCSKEPDAFRAQYWVVTSTHDSKLANAHFAKKSATISVTIGGKGEDKVIDVPIIENSKPVKVGDEIIIYKADIREKIVEEKEPPEKKARTEAPTRPTAKKGGKGKSKGASK